MTIGVKVRLVSAHPFLGVVNKCRQCCRVLQSLKYWGGGGACTIRGLVECLVLSSINTALGASTALVKMLVNGLYYKRLVEWLALSLAYRCNTMGKQVWLYKCPHLLVEAL